jgi:hypothetical protein
LTGVRGVGRLSLGRGQVGRDPAERVRARQELLAQLGLEPRDGLPVRRPEPRTAKRPPADGHRDRDD